jgi:hypothetical protein
MPDASRRPLAIRIGPERAGALKSLARRWYEQDGLSGREIARQMLTTQGFPISHGAINSWVKGGHWRQAPTPNIGLMNARDQRKHELTVKGAKEGLAKCRRRCPTCYQLIEPGQTHLCQGRAVDMPKGRLTIWGGSYL